MSPLSGRAGRFIICWSFPASLRADMWKKRPQGHVVFDSNAIANKLTNRVGIRGDLGPIVIGYVHEVLEEGLDMHGVHPFLQTHPVLGNLLGALIFAWIRRLDAQPGCQLGPGPDLFVVELANELKDGEGVEALATTARWATKGLSQAGCP